MVALRSRESGRRWKALVLFALLVGTTSAGGQSPGGQPRTGDRAASVLFGSVVAADSAGALAGAEVVVQELGLRTRTDQAGNYLLAHLPAGTYTVVVRRWGFAAARGSVTLSGSDTAAYLAALYPVALPGITVVAPAARDPKRADLESRMERAAIYGHLLDRLHFDRIPGRRLTAAITRASGVRLALVNGKYVAASTRGSIATRSGAPCFMAVYLDGMRIYPAGRSPPVNLDDFVVDDIEAVEVYSGPARVPLEYRGTGSGACGVIAIWRRNTNPSE